MDESGWEREELKRKADARLDEALDESFPASDPVAIHIDAYAEQMARFSAPGERTPSPEAAKTAGGDR